VVRKLHSGTALERKQNRDSLVIRTPNEMSVILADSTSPPPTVPDSYAFGDEVVRDTGPIYEVVDSPHVSRV
jgi:hypothetical protein